MSYCQITCGHCGHKADMFDFTFTPVFGDLPKREFQCPACMVAIRIEAAGALRVLTAPGGEVLAFREKTVIVPIGARL